MKRIGALIGLACLATGVHADENQFAGFYAGVNAGMVQGGFTSTEYSGPWDYGEYSATSSLEMTYGVQGGYNFAVGSAGIIGIELAYSMPDIDEERYFDDGDYVNSAEWNAETALRFKGGIAVDNVLLYATAGIVKQDVDFVFGEPTDPSDYVAKTVKNQGLSYGAGVEVAISDLLSVRGEYLTNNSQSEEIADFDGDTGEFHADSSSFTIGLNAHF
ncbi:MAG: outer membrane beta-barrel protein [Gammaproteobacteria bacterium]|jgi:outer membrane immunogenic protein|nr:outer membrane beta-barrel protein [Gammaproteobacteria bacterium]MBQ0774224.1 outer membrane beta-barrel protein [Gammaproteobacteria bacterium]